MRIWIGTYQLAGTGRDGVSGFTINGREVVDISELLGFDQIYQYDRGCLKTTITFSVSREHTSVGDAEVFMLEHASGLPKRAHLKFSAIDNEGREVTRWIKNACIEENGSRYEGVSTYHNYRVVGGKILTKDPNTE